MITHIRMKNFKSWKDSGEVKLAPLTGFFGTNSSGKSSLLQMLLLLKQTIGREEVLFFGDENSLVNLGSFREVIHGHKEEELLELELMCKLRKPYPIDFSMKDRFPSMSNIDGFSFKTVISEEEENLTVQRFFYFTRYTRTRIVWDKDQILYRNLEFREATQLADGDVKNCYGTPIPEKELGDKITWSQKFLRQFSSAFEELFAHVHPLGPTRAHPKRHYHWEETGPDSVGQNGEYMIDSMLNARVDQQTTPYKGQNVPIEDRISWWLREMDLAYSFSIKRNRASTNRDYEVLIQKGPDSAKVTLADMGYGLSQFLPVLVHCYYAPEGSTLILEQPGIHLHPKVQSQLADLLIEVITERNLQILVESHSEHLLTRLQRRIAEEKIASDQTALYFCRNDEGISTIERLEIDELGNIKNWPPNFFGNEMGDLFAMTKAQRERHKRAEG